MKKNFVTIVTALALVLSLAGCSVTVNGPAAGQTQTTSGKDEAASSEQAAETAEADAPASEALQECELQVFIAASLSKVMEEIAGKPNSMPSAGRPGWSRCPIPFTSSVLRKRSPKSIMRESPVLISFITRTLPEL